MLFKSGIVTQASGSIGGLTASHNSGGMYFRARAIPTDPNTVAQQAIRTALANAADRWVNVLTTAQRTAWATYASNVPLLSPLGDPREVSGMAQYVRSNVPRIRAGAALVDDGPTIFTEAELTAVTLTATALGAALDVGFDVNDAWVGEDDAHLIVQVGTPQNPTINFFKQPFRFAGTVDGDSGTPPTSPATITSPIPFAAGQRIFIRARVSRADGRLSPAQIVFDDV